MSWGKQGFDFIGCHLRKRMSGPIWEREKKRVYFLNRWPSSRGMKRVRARITELAPRGRCHEDVRSIIKKLNPVLQGWGGYFRTGNEQSGTGTSSKATDSSNSAAESNTLGLCNARI